MSDLDLNDIAESINEEIEKNVISIDELSSSKDSIFENRTELLRYFHNIKGNALIAGHNDLSEVSHTVEDELLTISPDSIESVYQVVKNYVFTIKEYLEAITTYGSGTLQVDKIFTVTRKELSIALVDDEEDFLEILEDLLEEASSQKVGVDKFSSALKGLEALNENRYDIIFCDYHMPEADGETLIKNIRMGSNLNSTSPIVLLTAHTPSLIPDGKIWDNVYFQEKPVSVKRLSYLLKLISL